MSKAVYIRTSTEEQSPENQKQDCFSLLNNSKDVEIYLEKQSAWKDNKEREVFETLKKDISKGKVERLVVWDLDRIYRNRKKLISFFEFCKQYKVKIHSYRQQWLEQLNNIQEPFNDIMFNLMLEIMGWLAEEESRKKSERVKTAFRSGKYKNWGRPSLPKSAINEVLSLYNQGYSLRKISQSVFYWDKSRNKRKVSLGGVHKIISYYMPSKSS